MLNQNDFITSDLHVDHPSAITYCKRPFTSVEQMRQHFIDEINNLPGKGRLVVVGDFFTSSKKQPARDFLDQIKREIIFVLGNHDKRLVNVFSDYGQVHWYLEAKCNDIKLCIQHMPMFEWDRGHYGTIHFHGHTHGNFAGHGKMLDVGWDAHGRILTIPEAIELADRRPIYQPCHSKNNGKHRDDL